jgi:hypothetical protein
MSMALHTFYWPWDRKRRVSDSKWRLHEMCYDEMTISNACVDSKLGEMLAKKLLEGKIGVGLIGLWIGEHHR